MGDIERDGKHTPVCDSTHRDDGQRLKRDGNGVCVEAMDTSIRITERRII
jgi:hypothetical protein